MLATGKVQTEKEVQDSWHTMAWMKLALVSGGQSRPTLRKTSTACAVGEMKKIMAVQLMF